MEGGVPVGSDGDAAANSDPIQLSSAFLVDWYVLLLVGVACLLTKALHRLAAMLCPLLVRLSLPEPPGLAHARREILALRQELQGINMMENFTAHARMKRHIISKKQEMDVYDSQHRKRHRMKSVIISTVLTLVIEALRIATVITYRHRPVLQLPMGQLWPITSILSFPTGVPGAISVPIWALICRQTIETSQAVWTDLHG